MPGFDSYVHRGLLWNPLRHGRPGSAPAAGGLRPGVPSEWEHAPSVCGPLATLEQAAAARLGGASLAATAFWRKLASALGFAAVGYAGGSGS
jgi:hypothetical protein